MTEEQTPGTEDQPSATEDQPSAAEDQPSATEDVVSSSEILDELHSLGQQLTTAVKSLWDSEESRKLRQEIGDGFVELGHQVETAVDTALESEEAKQFSAQVKDTMEKARESDIPGKMEEYLVTGLRELNTQVSKMVTSLESSGTPKEEQAEPEADAEA